MKKKTLAMIITAACVLSLTACSGANSTPVESTAPVQSADSKAIDAGAVGDYDVKIGDCAFGQDYEGKKMIVVNYDFANNSSKTAMPLVAVTVKAFQDGVELAAAIAVDASTYDAGIAQKEIKPGASITGCQAAYVLSSESPVEVEVSPLIGDVVLSKTFDVK